LTWIPKGKPAGSIGDAGCFSFYPGKNLGAYGEAGAITTNNAELAEKMQMFRDHGQSRKYYHAMIGWNARMDGFQGAVLNTKLKYLPSWIEARRKNAQLYNKSLSTIDSIIESTEADYAKHVYHVYTARVQSRDKLIAKLAEKDIHCGIHYPVPVHLQDAYLNSGYTNPNLKISESVASEILSLPMYPELTESQIEYVIEAIKDLMADN